MSIESVHSATGDALTTSQLYDLLRLRVDVFIVEQECPYPELDGQDLSPGTTHFWVPGAGDSGLAGCLRVLDDGDGVRRIGRVCTAAKVRGTGVGLQLMEAAVTAIGDGEAVLGAQTYAQSFYARFGFQQEGEVYYEDGIAHISMRRPAGSVEPAG